MSEDVFKPISVTVGYSGHDRLSQEAQLKIEHQIEEHIAQINSAIQDGYHIAFITPICTDAYTSIVYTLLRDIDTSEG